MAKTSKAVPKKDKALSSSASRPAKPVVPLTLEEITHGDCIIKKDFGIENPPNVGANVEAPRINENAPSEELRAVTTGHSLSLPTYSKEAIEEANTLHMPDLIKVIGSDPFQSCYAGVERADDFNDASSIFAITKFKAELKKCKIELKRVSDEEKALRLLCSQKKEELKDLQATLDKAQKAYLSWMTVAKAGHDWQLRGKVNQVWADCHKWKENMNWLVAEKEDVKAQLTSAEAQLRSAEAKDWAQAREIEGLGAELAKARTEAVNDKAEATRAKAKAEKTKDATDKSIIVYKREVVVVQAELRVASDRAKWSSELAKCQARMETLEEVHARGFDLAEETAEAQARETDARFLASSNDEDVVSGSGDGKSEEDASDGEEAQEDKATGDEDGTLRGVAPKID
uniref:Uncharacterized protein LOC104235815 n=1 Tax=Nicotiana sylvestris TaxID=4096 RepID=A0A1U7XLV9_NICSY|nr:PREDICTED: uncharacterized protein LOC104235815 [Nicotiana sylvestris]